MKAKSTLVYKRVRELEETLLQAKSNVSLWINEENDIFYKELDEARRSYSVKEPPPDWLIGMESRRVLNTSLLTSIEKSLDSILVLTQTIKEHRQYKRIVLDNALPDESKV